MSTAVPDVQSRVVSAHGHRIHYLESGSGPLVLLDFLRDAKPVAEVREAAS